MVAVRINHGMEIGHNHTRTRYESDVICKRENTNGTTTLSFEVIRI